MKHTALVLVALTVLSAVAFGQNLQKGDFVASVGSEGWTLSSGTGERVHIEFITFDKVYEAPPTVLVSLAGYDATAGSDGTVKLHLTVDKITKAGCIIKVKTWGDSKVGAVWCSWLAMSK